MAAIGVVATAGSNRGSPACSPGDEAAVEIGRGAAERLQQRRRQRRLVALVADEDDRRVARTELVEPVGAAGIEAPLEHVAGHDPRTGDRAVALDLLAAADVDELRATALGGERLVGIEALQALARDGEQRVDRRLAAARRAHRTSIRPGCSATSRPMIGASIAAAASGATAISSPPEVMASVSSTRRSSATSSANPAKACGLLAVAPAAARDRALVRGELEHATDRGHGRRLELGADAARQAQLVEMAEQAEAGHVGGGAGAGRDGGPGGSAVELAHDRDGFLEHRRGGEVALRRGRRQARAERLAQHERVSGPPAGVGQHPLGIDDAADGEPVLGLGVVDRVAAANDGTGRGNGLEAAGEDLAEQLGRQLVQGEGDEVDRDERRAAHRVDVGERVGGGDPAEVTRVVDDRGEEVGGVDERLVLVDPEDGRVVGGVGADEQVGMPGQRQIGEHRGEPVAGDLARAPGAVGERGKARVGERLHRPKIPCPHGRYTAAREQPGDARAALGRATRERARRTAASSASPPRGP